MRLQDDLAGTPEAMSCLLLYSIKQYHRCWRGKALIVQLRPTWLSSPSSCSSAGLTSHGIATTVGTRQQAESTRQTSSTTCFWLSSGPFWMRRWGILSRLLEAASSHGLSSRVAKSSRLHLPLPAADIGATWTVFAARAAAAGQGHGMTVKFPTCDKLCCNGRFRSADASPFPGCVDVGESFQTSALATSHLRCLWFSRALVFAIKLRAS